MKIGIISGSHQQESQSIKVAKHIKSTLLEDKISCGKPAVSCCGASDDTAINTLLSTRLGYSQSRLDLTPEGARHGIRL